MKYTSLTDLLGLSLDEISNLDSNGIIRLQKQLKAKAMLEDASNIGELLKIVNNLKDDNTRQCYIFIEKHSWIKKLISGNHKNIALNEIDVNSLLIENLEELKVFLNPYLKENLKLFLAENLSNGNYEQILKVLKHNYLFTEENNQIVINFFRARLNYASAYIGKGKLKEKLLPVAYVSHKTFIKCLNIYPDTFNVEIHELNPEVIEVYNSNRKKTSREDFKFAAKVMVALSILDTSNIFLKDNLEANAKIAREYTLPSHLQKEKSGSGFSWNYLFIAFIVIRVIFWIAKLSSNNTPDYKPYSIDNFENNPGINTNDLNEMEKMFRDYQNKKDKSKDIQENNNISTTLNEDKTKQSNHIRFIYTMKRKVNRKSFTDAPPTVLDPFSNPYSKTFIPIPYVENNSSDGSYVLIKNQSKKDLIVFKLTDGIDQSIYIPKDNKVSIVLRAQDSVVFYTGKDFVEDRFSHFKYNTDLSRMYKIENYGVSEKEITIHPFKNTVKVIKSKSSKKARIDTLKIDNINAKNLTLKSLSIDAIYTDYYNKHYRN